MNDALEKLFGSPARVKIIRLFLQNPSDLFISKEISRKCKIDSNVARREISLLSRMGLIKQKTASIDTIIKLKNGKISAKGGPASGWKNKKKKIQGLGLNEMFSLISPLKNLFIEAVSFNKERMIKGLKSSGDVKLIILSGFFTQAENSPADLLLVGDRMQKPKLDRILKRIERELGKEIVFTFFDTKEFLYRFSMYDRFIRDILDYPHEKVLNKLEI